LGKFLEDEDIVIVKDNEILRGIIDKNQLGAGAEYGLMHAFHELYGPKLLGKLFSCFSRLFGAYI
jgi:DNA-directed RNA polymerase I subunit RPA1